jgi:cell division septal protein FtsQ
MEETASDRPDHRNRKRQRVRIRFKERVRIKERPKGYHIKRFFKKRTWLVVVIVMLLTGIGAVMYWVIATNAEKEQKRIETRIRLHEEKVREQNR